MAASVLFTNVFSKFPFFQFTAKANTKYLATLADLIEQGKIQTHIDKRYSYEEIPEAIAYIEKMRTRGKVVMEWEG